MAKRSGVAVVMYAVLAAGASTRMGFAKAIRPLRGRSPLQRLSTTLQGRRFLIVTNADIMGTGAIPLHEAAVVINEHPGSGLASSLRVANAHVDPDAHLGVLLADKPFVRPQTLAVLEEAASHGADVVYPIAANGTAGHPVIFSPNARRHMPDLPDGDSVRALRDDPLLTRTHVACSDVGAFWDLDTPDDWAAAQGMS